MSVVLFIVDGLVGAIDVADLHSIAAIPEHAIAPLPFHHPDVVGLWMQDGTALRLVCAPDAAAATDSARSAIVVAGPGAPVAFVVAQIDRTVVLRVAPPTLANYTLASIASSFWRAAAVGVALIDDDDPVVLVSRDSLLGALVERGALTRAG